ncbi:hypothetical protein BV25DRAFT_1826111 [Artomyces pyxidatus]|uniref:Uncharacterized protein n=1 Tax=Artomyces pyxidatus TaxID=48021 RepID=A0ACB8T067_9AGAM|nr:hypothetical protein BV25DRAFT_1826111 [Artomyces pyxidatus]
MPARHVHAAPRAPSPLLRPASSRAAAAASASDMSELNLDEDALIWLDTTLPSGAPPAFNLLTPFPIIPPGVDNVEEYLLRQHLRTLEERCTIGGWRAEVAGATQPDAERVADEEDELDSDSEGGGGSLVGGEYTDSMEEEDELEDDEEGGTDQATVTEADAMEEEERHQREGTSASEEAQLAESIALLCASLYPSFFPASEAQREREWGAFAEYTRARSGETAHLLPGYVPSRAGPRTEHLPAFPSDHFDAWRIPQVAPATDGRIDPDYIVDASDDGDEVWGPDVGGPFCLPPTGAHPPRWVPGVRPARRAPSVSVRFNHRNVPYARAPAVRAGYV